MGINIQQTTTPNCEDRIGEYKPDIITYHITEGSYDGTILWVKNPGSGLSFNFIVSRTGRIIQLVPLIKRSWANGTTTSSSKKNYYGRSTNKYVSERRPTANDYTISIANEGFYEKTGGALTSLQLQANIQLTQYIREQIKSIYGVTIPIDKNHLIGHSEISPKENSNCPGNQFQWEELIHGVKVAAGEIREDKTIDIINNNLIKEIDLELYEVGRKIILNNTFIFSTPTSSIYNILSGTYYLYDGKNINGKYRITNSLNKVGKAPIENNVFGYILKESVPTVTIDTDVISVIVKVEPINRFSIGRAITLVNASLYTSSIIPHSSGRLNGTYYLYDGKEIDGRYRITNKKEKVAQEPLSINALGFIDKSVII